MAQGTGTMADAKPTPIQKVKDFVLDIRTEMDKVTWPTRDDLKTSTRVTLIMIGIMAVIVFFYDRIFQIIMLLLLRVTT